MRSHLILAAYFPYVLVCGGLVAAGCGGGPATPDSGPPPTDAPMGMPDAPMAMPDAGQDSGSPMPDAGQDSGPPETAPTVVGTSPAAGAVDVDVATTVTATFSEAMTATTINGTSVTLADDLGAAITATVTYDAPSLTATLSPGAALDPTRVYTATIAVTVTDAGGTPLAAAFTWSFAPGGFTVSTTPGTTVFDQIVPLDPADTDLNSSYYLPNHTNVWDIQGNFGLSDGGDDQVDGAVEISDVTTTVGSAEFPYDQDYTELAWWAPAFGTSDGVVGAGLGDATTIAALSGGFDVRFANVPNASIEQTIALTTAVAPITLTWTSLGTCNLDPDNSPPPALTGTVLDVGGATLATFDALADTTFDLSTFAGQVVTLRFTSTPGSTDYCNPNQLDDVSVLDSAATPSQLAMNGDFEAGAITPWVAAPGSVSQLLTAGVRTVSGLAITRTFYAEPTSLWGRWVDVYENPDTAALDATITYHTNMGSDDCGTIYEPDTAHDAIVSWDSGGMDDRDFGWVFGTNTMLTYTSETTHGGCDGSDNIDVVQTIHVPAGGRVALVHFVVMNGQNTWIGATATTSHATQIDAAVADIVANFRTNPRYRRGISATDLAAIANF